MSACTDYINTITPDECVGGSLTKINTNFNALQTVTCELEQRFDKTKLVRTFFYYGPNAQTDSTSGMANNTASRPSDATIQAFVNSNSQLNLPAISRPGDIAYVIYQKTGFKSNLAIDTSNVPSGVYNYGIPFNSPAVYAVTHSAWSSFMKKYAVWVNPGTAVSTGRKHTTYRKLSIPADGTYKFRCQADNKLTWYVDGTLISTAEGFTTNIVSRDIFLKAGRHTLQFDAINVDNGKSWSGNPGGWACTISDSKNIIWDTRAFKAGETDYSDIGLVSVDSKTTTKIDIDTLYAPVLIIWRLTYTTTEYTVDVSFPKFTRASTDDTANWNNPTAWATY